MKQSLQRYLKQQVGEIISSQVRDDLKVMRENEAKTPRAHPVDAVAIDPIKYHQEESAKALAIGVATSYTANIRGDVAEFGTMTGYSAHALARTISLCEATLLHCMAVYRTPPKRLHLFDSFSGLPEMTFEADRTSPHVVDGAWTPGSCRGLTEAELKSLVGKELPSDRSATYAGWFKDTLPNVSSDLRLAVAHIDGDLYSSAIDVLENLFGRNLLSPGAILFFDDWNCNHAALEHGERRAWAEVVERFGVVFSDRGGYGLFGHSFFIHSWASAGQR